MTSLSLEVCRQKQMTICLWNVCQGCCLGAGFREAQNSDYWEVIDISDTITNGFLFHSPVALPKLMEAFQMRFLFLCLIL